MAFIAFFAFGTGIRMAKTITIGEHSFSRRVKASQQKKPFVVQVEQRDFLAVINRWPGLVEDQVEQIVNEVTILAFANVKERTPVLTGRAKSQWFITVPSRFVRFIGNNVPYIRRLEHGWSRKSNRWFMVRSTEKKIPMWVNQIAGRLWRGGLERKAA